ncbi:unnamed protein product [Owenia fusiformis]|uniref:BPTI/Kunitz inhibitor domain-containing protein n=1 Tax=Owenia fusiformis TaxID=6347 RepID=A0A8S4PCH0_OWEFU|nr:unnamed protein product [Owenia fusiformis]
MLLFGVFSLLLWSQVANAEDELICPPVKEGMVGACANLCGDDCTGGQLCCSNGCGHRCMDGVIKPTPPKPDLCLLPSKVGKCKARLERYYYDNETKECKLFYYGGCDANENNFEKKEDCEKRCGDVDMCNLPKKQGKKKCAEDKVERYFYNSGSMACEMFSYSGCGGGNLNNFGNSVTCKQTCDACSKPKVIGPCKAAFPRYFYSIHTGQCENFLYGGCRGNNNNFQSKEQCEGYCKPTCEYYCQKCKQGKKFLARCSGCKQRKIKDYTKCAACVMSGKGKFDYQCFNCEK